MQRADSAADGVKVFNTTANCIPEENYMVDISERLEEIKKMVDEKNILPLIAKVHRGLSPVLT